MSTFNVSDYEVFNTAKQTTGTCIEKIKDNKTIFNECKSKLEDTSIFMGPICDNAIGATNDSLSKIDYHLENFGALNDYISNVYEKYKNGDASSFQVILKEEEQADGTFKISTEIYNDGLIHSTESGYTFPFAQGVSAPITSHVGLRNAPTAGASTNHKGTDIGVSYGTEIHAIYGGTVINAGRSDAGGFGNWVRIRQDDGNVVSYGHVSKSNYFNVGDRVEAGDVIANVGSEGISTGPHLHLEIHDANGNLLDSENYFADCWPS